MQHQSINQLFQQKKFNMFINNKLNSLKERYNKKKIVLKY